MSVNVSGNAMVEAELRKILGKEAMVVISDKALVEGAKVFVKELQSQIKTFSDGQGQSKGYTYDEITLSEPYTLNGVRNITVHWRGPKQRYRIIHLNEFGTVKNPSPKGKGAIARALQASEAAYRSAIEQSLRGAF